MHMQQEHFDTLFCPVHTENSALSTVLIAKVTSLLPIPHAKEPASSHTQIEQIKIRIQNEGFWFQNVEITESAKNPDWTK